ncbi:hypothetical protein H5410_037977, partial [Solanum commersonii]
DPSTKLVRIADTLGNPLFVVGRYGTDSRNFSAMRRLFHFLANLIFSFRAQHTGTKSDLQADRRLTNWACVYQTQVQLFKKDVSNNATQDSIMDAHNKTHFTHAKINCTLKDSSCDSLLSKNIKLTILASNASSSLTKIKMVFSRLVMGLSANPLRVLSHWVIWYYFAELLGDAPTIPFHRQLDLFLQGSALWNKGDLQADQRLANWARRSSGLHFFVLFSRLVPSCQVVSMLCLKLQIPET